MGAVSTDETGCTIRAELVYEVSDEITERTVCSDDKQTRCSQLEEQQACIFSMTGTTVTVHFYLLSINVGTRLLPCQEDVPSSWVVAAEVALSSSCG